MLRTDLKAAGIEWKNDEGQRIDFLALRTTLVTQLVRAGVTLATAQRLARHSTPALTAKNYTRLELSDLAGSVAILTAPSSSPETLAATGTDDAGTRNRDDLFTVPVTVRPDKMGTQVRIPDETGKAASLVKEAEKPLIYRGFLDCPRQESNLHGIATTRPST